MPRRSRKKIVEKNPSINIEKFSPPLSSHQQISFWQKVVIFLFHLMVLIIPFAFSWLNDELFEFNKMILTYGFTVLIVSSWLSRMISEQRLIFKKTIFDVPIFLFLISQILSTIFSIDPYTSVFGYYSRFHGGLLSTISYTLLYYAFVNNFNFKQIKKFFITIFVSAIGVSLYAIPEHFGHSPSCYLITDGAKFDVSCWVQDVQNRIFGTFGQPNWLAAYMITLIPVSITYLLGQTKKIPLQIFYASHLILAFATLIFTKSRSGLLGLAIGLSYLAIVIIFYILTQKSKQLTQQVLTKGTIIVLIFWALVAWFGTPLTPTIQDLISKQQAQPVPTEISTQNENQVINRLEVGGTESGEIRKIVWEGAIKVWQRYPILGSGVETFAYSYYLDRPLAHNTVSEWDFLYNKAHNEFLNFLATTGIIGLFTYLSLFAFLAFYSLRFSTKIENNQKFLLAHGLMAGIIALSVSNFFGFSTVMVSILMFLFFAIFQILQQEQIIEEDKTPPSLSASHYFGISMVWLLSIYFILMVINIWSADATYKIGKQFLSQDQLIKASDQFEKAIQKSPSEALFYDSLSTTYAQIANALDVSGDATLAAQVATRAIEVSDKTLELNPNHLNFYRNRARVFIYLSQLDESFLKTALTVLEDAQQLAPNDAKIMYNRALIADQLGDKNQAFSLLIDTIDMKPNYDGARSKLAEMYLADGNTDLAIEQYQYILEFINPNSEVAQEMLERLK